MKKTPSSLVHHLSGTLQNMFTSSQLSAIALVAFALCLTVTCAKVADKVEFENSLLEEANFIQTVSIRIKLFISLFIFVIIA